MIWRLLVIAVFVAGCDRPAKAQRKAELPREAQVIQTLRINESETVKVLTVPDPLLSSEPILDTRCLIYTHQEFRQSVIKCMPKAGVSGPDTP